MVYSIESILNKRTRSGRVEYLIKWDGYDEEENTWETRVDLMKDGHQKSIRSYEAEKKKKSSSGATSKSRSSSRSDPSSSPARSTTSRRSSVSKSPKRSTKAAAKSSASTSTRSSRRSTKKDTTTKAPAARSSRRTRRGSASPAKSATPKRRSATPKRREVSSSSEEESEDEKEEDEEEEKEETEAVSDMLGQTVTVEWVIRVFLLLALVLSMLASAIIPEIKNSAYLNNSPNMDKVLLVLEKTTAFPPLLCLLLVLRTKDTRAFASWVAICMVWRTAGEVLMQLPDDGSAVYSLAARAMFGVADFALIVSVCSIVGGEKPTGDILTMTLGVLGVLGVIGSDMILGLLEGTSLFASRFLIMAISLVLVTFSTLLQESI